MTNANAQLESALRKVAQIDLTDAEAEALAAACGAEQDVQGFGAGLPQLEYPTTQLVGLMRKGNNFGGITPGQDNWLEMTPYD